MKFVCRIYGNDWDSFVSTWASTCYDFVRDALGPYQKEPLPEILNLSDALHASGANASFHPDTGQICLSRSVTDHLPGITLEKLTHELTHASLADFPEGDMFYEEGFVDYMVWVMSHAPTWGEHQIAMKSAASFNIKCRQDRAKHDLSDYDRKRWAGGVYCSHMHGPWIIARMRTRKAEHNFTW
jgi:hypothetical protein